MSQEEQLLSKYSRYSDGELISRGGKGVSPAEQAEILRVLRLRIRKELYLICSPATKKPPAPAPVSPPPHARRQNRPEDSNAQPLADPVLNGSWLREMREVTASGRTREEAARAARRFLSKLGDKYVIDSIEVLDPGKRGFLGFGARPAVVKAQAKIWRREERPPNAGFGSPLFWFLIAVIVLVFLFLFLSYGAYS